MKTLKSIGLIMAATIFTAPSMFAAIIGTGSLTISAPGLPDVNGPYLVNMITTSTGPSLGTSFETFCIGSQVDYNSGQSYSYQINTSVQPFTAEGGGGLQYVALGTAWLYSQYRAGNIGDGSANDSVNNDLQLAIWYLQGQVGGMTNQFTAMAAAHVGAANVENMSNGAYNVYALDLSVGSGNSAPGDLDGFAQPQLAQIPVPEPTTIAAGAMLLLPLGASMVRVLRNRKS